MEICTGRQFIEKRPISTKMGPKKGKKGKKADDDWGNEEDEKRLEEKIKVLAVDDNDGEGDDLNDAPKAKGKKKDKKGNKKKKAAAAKGESDDDDDNDDDEVDKEELQGLTFPVAFCCLSQLKVL